MTEQNVQIVEAALAALNRGDLDSAFRWAARDCEIDMTRAVGVDRGVFTVDEFRALSDEFSASWQSARWEADEVIDAGEHVVVSFTNRLLGRDGIEVDARGVWAWTIQDGATTRLCLYQSRDEALEDLGIRD